jgi:nucleotide-binding universal stress UspA family protein
MHHSMVKIAKILCPVDFSDASKHALAQALVIAGWYGATVTLLHVRPDGDVLEASERLGYEDEVACLTAGAPDVAVTALFETGHAVTSIVDCAASLGVDLIVMGSHGTNGFERLLLGSVTDGVLRKAGCPVLVVPPRADATTRLPFTHLLCPVDFSPASRTGLALACSIAQEADAQLTLLHVIDLPPENELITSGPFAYPRDRDQRERDAHIALKCLVPHDLRTSRPPVTLVTFGKPYREILRIAAEHPVDLIVSGVHGRHTLDLLIFGSTTNQVIRRAPCPVLSVRR